MGSKRERGKGEYKDEPRMVCKMTRTPAIHMWQQKQPYDPTQSYPMPNAHSDGVVPTCPGRTRYVTRPAQTAVLPCLSVPCLPCCPLLCLALQLAPLAPPHPHRWSSQPSHSHSHCPCCLDPPRTCTAQRGLLQAVAGCCNGVPGAACLERPVPGSSLCQTCDHPSPPHFPIPHEDDTPPQDLHPQPPGPCEWRRKGRRTRRTAAWLVC